MSTQRTDIDDLIRGIRAGDRISLAKGITLVENNWTEKEKLVSSLYGAVGKAHRIGITGPPGVGKSSLTVQLAKTYRENSASVGVVAVDPTSFFTGGALLGDRIRMNELFNDPGVFIRSMATRGSLGGLAVAATEAADLMDAAGLAVIFFETVGTGQSELDIAEACDSVILVLAPESGDGVQALKAGFMEIADILVINKSDREGAGGTEQELKTALSLRERGEWDIPVVRTVATRGEGLGELKTAINRHYAFLNRNRKLEERRREHLVRRVKSIVRNLINEAFWTDERIAELTRLQNVPERINRSPYSIAHEIIGNFLR